MANRGGGHQTSFGGHQNVQQSHQHQRNYSHSNRTQTNTYTPQPRISLNNQTASNITASVPSNQNQNIQIGLTRMPTPGMMGQQIAPHQVNNKCQYV